MYYDADIIYAHHFLITHILEILTLIEIAVGTQSTSCITPVSANDKLINPRRLQENPWYTRKVCTKQQEGMPDGVDKKYRFSLS